MRFAASLESFSRYFYRVPWCVPAWGWKEFRASLGCAISGNIAEGNFPQRFADAIKTYLGLPYALPVNRGRAAIELALRAMGLAEWDEVLLPSYVCHTVPEAVERAGTRPVFCDIGPDLHITPQVIEAALTPRTKCVIVPHLFGNAAPIDEIEKLLRGTGVQLIDDAAQSFGARCAGRPVGTFGTCGIVSCGPGKALAGSAGGLLVTRERELFERAAQIPLARESSHTVARRVLSFWIWRRFRSYTLPISVLLKRALGVAVNREDPYVPAVLSNMEAAIALEQLRVFPGNLRRRRGNAEALLKKLGGQGGRCISDLSARGALVKLVLLLSSGGPGAEAFIDSMAREGVECRKGYTPLHLGFGSPGKSLVYTEAVWNQVVELPIEVGLNRRGRCR